ncbi:terpene synthase family protein [Archangium sp.]|uniref:terpene synthase family protein n=1 Tax=Archangium sp. TaxID=1872627 RepID=UPI002D50FE79|nr:terpene synthase family protein [Archangium sp.]HYO57851.1 terpene synthase family protein [Archangium sp.]
MPTFTLSSSFSMATADAGAQDREFSDGWQLKLERSHDSGLPVLMPPSTVWVDVAQAHRRSELMGLLREAAVRLQPEHWLSRADAKPSDFGFEDVRSRYQHWTEHAPFNTACPASWRGLVDLAISYSSYTYRPARGVRQAEADALVSWFTCFWKLDNLVDDAREHLPVDYLDTLRQAMERAWFGDEDQLDGIFKHPNDLLAFYDQAVALLIDHRQQLRALGQPIENHPEYREAVWKHIVCQTEAPPQVDSLEEYLEMRRVRGGMECVLHMYLALQGIDWDESFARIIDVANIVTCLTDDLFSAVKDQRDGVVSAITVCGPNGHLRVLELVRELHQELLELLERRVAADASVSTQLFVRTVLDVVLGMMEWQGANPRYREGALWLNGLLRTGGAESTLDSVAA